MSLRRNFFLYIVFLLGRLVFCQDVTESPTSTIKGSFQGETGVFFETFENGGLRNNNYTLGATLLLYGLHDNWELRMGFAHEDAFERRNGQRLDGVVSGFGPLQLGTAVDILPEKGILPQVTILGDLFLPFLAGNEIGSSSTEYEFRSIFYHTLSKSANLSYNLGMFIGSKTVPIYTLAYNQNFSKKWGSYTEVYGDFSKTGSSHFWDIGLTYLLTPKLQFDTVLGTAIKGEQDVYFGARLTFSTIENQYIAE